MLIIGDLHLKNKEPFLSSQQNLLQFIEQKYPDEILIFLGDIFDNSSPHWEVYKIFKQFLITHKNKIFLLTGNHDFSRIKGNVLQPFTLLSNVIVIDNIVNIEIENKKCLFIPFIQSQYEYNNLKGQFDYIFCHVTPGRYQFYNEGVSFENIKNSYIIYGHYHIQKDIYEDENYNKHHIIGVPIETRNGENQKHKIIHIKDTLQEISLPLYFTFENIQYGEFPKNKNNILNIKNAPSLKAVYELYKGYYIREEGIEINKSQSLEIDDITNKQHKSFNEITLQEKFKLFIDDKNINNEGVVKECLLRISNNG